MKNYELVASSLRLFNCVPYIGANWGNHELHGPTGILITPGAMTHRDEIVRFFSENRLTAEKINKTFFEDFERVRNTPLVERLTHQLTHYFSTYGLRAMGIDAPDFMYMPVPVREIVELATPLVTIKAVEPAEILVRSVNMLSGVALKQQTIEDLYSIFSGLGEDIGRVIALTKNREALVYFCDKSGIVPEKGEELLRYLVYRATGETLVINSKQLLEKIKSSGFDLPSSPLSTGTMEELAQNFNRHKPIWLAFKQANRRNGPFVNRISRDSKRLHKPMAPNVLGTFTSGKFNLSEVERAAKNASTPFQLTRALNAALFYSEREEVATTYKVRNGRLFLKIGDGEKRNLTKEARAIRSELMGRVLDKTYYIPEGVEYALPSSEKMFSGAVPKGTKVQATFEGESLLVGVYWENGPGGYTDLDLSFCDVQGNFVGWHGAWSGSNVDFTGDITSAPKGAAEWFEFRGAISSPGLISVNLYGSHDEECPFKIMVARVKSDNVRHGYVASPEEIVFTADSSVTGKSRNRIIGLVSPVPGKIDRVEFTLVDEVMGNRSVTTPNGMTANTTPALLERTRLSFPLRQVVRTVATPEEADVDLTPTALDRDTILSIFH